MPEVVPKEDRHGLKRCARCDSLNPTFFVRKDSLCKACLSRYVSTKVYKRLESNKIRGGYNEPAKRILLPVSFGVSSICLLYVLDEHLKNRLEQGRHAGFTLQVLHIDQYCLGSASIQDQSTALKQRFPAYQFSSMLLEDFWDYNMNIGNFLDETQQRDVAELSSNSEKLQYILSTTRSPTSKADLIAVLRRRLTAAFALQHSCTAILYGDTTTRLAERTLSETANGRGVLLPQLTTDGYAPDGVPVIYPARDVLKKELNLYAQVTEPPLSTLIVEDKRSHPAASAKDNTIDGLMRQYFQSVEEAYPSIVANVVRTTGKLNAPPMDQAALTCELCQQTVGTAHWGGYQEAGSSSAAGGTPDQLGVKSLCYGCTRTIGQT